MAASGHRVMPVGGSALDRMLAAVESLDDLVHKIEDAGIPWKDCAAVARIAASLRPSPMGGLEGFRTQISWFEGLWLDVLDDENLYVRMPSSTALYMLDRLPRAYVDLVSRFVDLFLAPRIRG